MDRQPRLAASFIQRARGGARDSSLLRGPSSSGRQHKRNSLDFGSLHQTSAGDLVDRLKNEIEALQKQLIEQKAQDTQQIAVLRTAAAVFAHEIANPLNAVSTCVQILEMEIEHRMDLNSVVHDLIESASTEIERLTSVLNDFRSFARPQAINLRPIFFKQGHRRSACRGVVRPPPTTKLGGSGLGLPIAAQIVASHGGTFNNTSTGPRNNLRDPTAAFPIIILRR
jgi:signal transduction histidine kinase